MTSGTLSDFQHRADYDVADGSARWTARHVGSWVAHTLPRVLATAGDGAVLDAGCGAQPFRGLIEREGRRYVGMDAVQNQNGSVEILSALEDAPAFAVPFPVVLCTEVLEHVVDIDQAFGGLRRACAPGGDVVMTVPFVYPLHMEPYDFRRLTLHGIERLAHAHGFTLASSERLGTGSDVLATMLADVSVLPTTGSLYARAKVRALRAVKMACIAALDSSLVRGNIAMNSNFYLTNGVVLRSK